MTGPDSPDYPAAAAAESRTVTDLDAHLVDCRACPRLVAWREEVATVKRPGFQEWEYWGRPVPSFGPADAPVLLVGLAPAANGGNRTGRMFTGDPSGDLLFAILHELGVASQPESIDRGDGLTLHDVRITAAVHCAPPDNHPTTAERNTCRTWLARELQLLDPGPVAIAVLGGFAWQALFPVLAAAGWDVPVPRPRFGHGVEVVLTRPDSSRRLRVFGTYHPSRRNISTGTVTPAMIRDVLHRVLIAGGRRGAEPA